MDFRRFPHGQVFPPWVNVANASWCCEGRSTTRKAKKAYKIARWACFGVGDGDWIAAHLHTCWADVTPVGLMRVSSIEPMTFQIWIEDENLWTPDTSMLKPVNRICDWWQCFACDVLMCCALPHLYQSNLAKLCEEGVDSERFAAGKRPQFWWSTGHTWLLGIMSCLVGIPVNKPARGWRLGFSPGEIWPDDVLQLPLRLRPLRTLDRWAVRGPDDQGHGKRCHVCQGICMRRKGWEKVLVSFSLHKFEAAF